MDTLSMCFYYVFADGQSQAGTALISAAGGICSVKSFEDAVQVFFFDPNGARVEVDFAAEETAPGRG